MEYGENLSSANGQSAAMRGRYMKKIIDKETYQEMVSKKFPKQKIEIIEFKSITEKCKVRCGLCGKIVQINADKYYKTSGDYLVINCCHSKGELEKQQCVEVIRRDKNKKLISFSKKIMNNKHPQRVITYQCLMCGRKYTKKLCDFLSYPKCYDCEKVSQKKGHDEFLREVEGKKIEPLEKYNGAYQKIKFRCNECGFIWSTRPHSILTGTGCPKCNRGKSKGEKKISEILDKEHIKYIPEANFKWSERYRYDFYLPDIKTLIEYHGQQHYKETNFFREGLEERQYKDSEKERLAKANGYSLIIISYKKYKVLESVIKSIVQRPSEKE